MKNGLSLSLWLLLAAVAIPMLPTMVVAKEKKEKREGLRKKYLAAKALYEKRTKEKAPAKELARLEKDMKTKRRKYRLAVAGITAGVVATAAAVGAAAYAATKEGTPTPTTPTPAPTEPTAPTSAPTTPISTTETPPQATACNVETIKKLIEDHNLNELKNALEKCPPSLVKEWEEIFKMALRIDPGQAVLIIIDKTPEDVKTRLATPYVISDLRKRSSGKW